MRFKGTVVITDPCYLDNDRPESDNQDWWDESSYGEDLNLIGLSDYLSMDTLYGDWSCFTYKGAKEEVIELEDSWNRKFFEFFNKYNFGGLTEAERVSLRNEFMSDKNKFIEEHTLGEFCADAGKVCVVYLDEVLKFNPYFEEWAKRHPWCVTIIEDFDGDVDYTVGEEMDLHLVGTGNKPFYTAQAGL